jgi:hypothetical protein
MPKTRKFPSINFVSHNLYLVAIPDPLFSIFKPFINNHSTGLCFDVSLISSLSLLLQHSSMCLYCQCHCLFTFPVHTIFINMTVILCFQFSHRYKNIRDMTVELTGFEAH